jgi:hypothetical protein
MEDKKVAARFLAFASYLNDASSGMPSAEAAGRFARGQWRSFLPFVRDDLGRLLTAAPRSPRDKSWQVRLDENLLAQSTAGTMA